MAYNFYNVLLVNQNATLDEIKLAFKKRALQVHPDKGGSKEAFHLVYQALETLADPLARRKYDNGLAASKPTVVQHPPQRGSRRKKKTSKKRAQPAERKQARSKAKKTQKSKSEPKTASHTQAGPEAPKARQSQEAKLLTKIHALLKLLPRDVRKDMITNHFSQKQRLTLENWMFDNSQQAKAEPGTQEVALALPAENVFVEGEDRSAKPATRAAAIQDQAASLDNSCADVAAPSIDSLSSRRRKPRIWQQARHRMIRDKNAESKPKTRKPCGFVTAVKRGSAYYKATIRFDALDIHTGQCDLQTALEYLVILTSAKQKMLDSTSTHAGAFFEGRLQEALASAASEQGKNVADLKLRFSVLQSLGFVVGNGFQLHSPVVRTIQELSKLRSCFEPFRQYSRKWGRRSAVWRYSPAHLEDAWERLQKATACAWESAGADSTKFMQKMRDCYNANASFRHRQLQYWERQQMASQDKNNYRPRRLQQRSTKRMELWEGSTWPSMTRTSTGRRSCKTRAPRAWSNESGYECQGRTRTSTAQRACETRAQAAWNAGSASRWPWRTEIGTGHGDSEFLHRNRSGEKNCQGACPLWKHCLWDGSIYLTNRRKPQRKNTAKLCDCASCSRRKTLRSAGGRKCSTKSGSERKNAWEEKTSESGWNPVTSWTIFRGFEWFCYVWLSRILAREDARRVFMRSRSASRKEVRSFFYPVFISFTGLLAPVAIHFWIPGGWIKIIVRLGRPSDSLTIPFGPSPDETYIDQHCDAELAGRLLILAA